MGERPGAGEHEGGHTPFRFDITSHLRPGTNTLTVRVEDPPYRTATSLAASSIGRSGPKAFSIPGPPESGRPFGWNRWAAAISNGSGLNRHIDGSVTFDADVARRDCRPPVLRDSVAEGRVLATSMAQVEGSQATARRFVRDPQWWSPDSPQSVRRHVRTDQWQPRARSRPSYFGFRIVCTQDGKVLLNGAPIFLKMVLDQGYWPESNLTPPSDDAIRYDIQMAKDMGFNGVRKHQKIEDPRFLYWADRMGLLVSAEMANAYMFDDESVGTRSPGSGWMP